MGVGQPPQEQVLLHLSRLTALTKLNPPVAVSSFPETTLTIYVTLRDISGVIGNEESQGSGSYKSNTLERKPLPSCSSRDRKDRVVSHRRRVAIGQVGMSVEHLTYKRRRGQSVTEAYPLAF